MRSDYCPIANEPCQCMCLGDCQLRRLKPAGEEDMRVYRAIASNYETEKARMTDTVIIPRALLEQALDALIWTTGSADFGEGGQAHSGALKILSPAITALRSALEQSQQEPVAWVWNPASGAWEKVHVYGFWLPGAIYTFGQTPPVEDQPQQEDPDLLAAYLYGFEKGKEQQEQERPKCRQCGDVLMSSFTQLCYGCKQEGKT